MLLSQQPLVILLLPLRAAVAAPPSGPAASIRGWMLSIRHAQACLVAIRDSMNGWTFRRLAPHPEATPFWVLNCTALSKTVFFFFLKRVVVALDRFWSGVLYSVTSVSEMCLHNYRYNSRSDFNGCLWPAISPND